MPGHRLAYPERRQITAGLAAGLTYAEIARRLDRPTSTITREISRNGGPGGYRAEPAQRATQQRARRRPPVAASPKPDTTRAAVEVIDTVRAQLIETIVRMGLPRMAARVFACLFLSDADSRTAAELAAELRVSPASISKAVTYLADVGMLLRGRDGRRERYRIGRDVWARTCMASAQVDRALADTARRGATLLGTDTPAGARLAEMAWCFQNLFGLELRGAERWRAFLEYSTGATPDDPDAPATVAVLHCPDCGSAVPIPGTLASQT
ncbi:helix-turn-helix domain-containing protein [Nocardia sp. NPDC051570]|uniref:GbsR/MarR family transcriptional regulator n=1 Tax=Nocardia sp. NPDC051570 TaxID=3364324 RepID=UPI0037A6730C